MIVTVRWPGKKGYFTLHFSYYATVSLASRDRGPGPRDCVGRRDFNIFKGVGTKRRIWSIPQV